MAELTLTQRRDCLTDLMQRLSEDRDPVAWTKAEGLAALGALDTWLNDNQATLNQVLPAAFRTAATTPQKARLLQFVAEWRYVKGA